MAVTDDTWSLYYPTQGLICKKARKHYKVAVRSQHWQLRSLISAEDRHIVYYPGGASSNHVQRLNTRTHECETIKFLTFAPRCLVAKDGWLCCGSEHGDFVSFRVNEGSASDILLAEQENESQTPNETTNSNYDSLLRLLSRSSRGQKQLVARNSKMARERVNCITLWAPPEHSVSHPLAYTFHVAVLANNDKTVTLVNLWEAEDSEKVEPIESISYPDYVNRAIISPDGRLLIAILDDPYLYIHERAEKGEESRSSSGSQYCWQQKRKVLLKSQTRDDHTNNRGSFAACFSSSGAYLAIGTQHGTVSVFDASLLTDIDADPLITTFQSSRPKTSQGAIRDMAFCPGPFDILAWSEDRGNIGIADARTNFTARQIIDINDQDSFEHITLLDRSTVDPRLLDRRNDQGDASATPRTRDTDSSDRRLELLNYPLTPNETMVLEALQGDRRRRERVNQRGGDGNPRTLQEIIDLREASNYLRWRGLTDSENSRAQEPGSGNRRGIGDLLGSYREQRDRANERVRTARQLLREAANDQPTRGQPPSSPGWARSGTQESSRQTLARVAESLTRSGDRHDPSYLDVLDILQARERGSGDDDRSSSLLPLVSQVVSGIVPDNGVFESAPTPDNTAGLAWSEDGRTLYIGAQNGIYEFQVNVHNRKLSPSVVPR